MAETFASSNASASGMIVEAFVVLALCVAATAPVAMAQSCNTNANSPIQVDVNVCVQYVRNIGSSQCCQINSSGCTILVVSGTASVQICGSQGTCTTCDNAGNSLNIILANCVVTVNGTARVSGSIGSGFFTFQISHS